MKINKLELVNFRCFEDDEITLSDRFTLLIGDNKVVVKFRVISFKMLGFLSSAQPTELWNQTTALLNYKGHGGLRCANKVIAKN